MLTDPMSQAIEESVTGREQDHNGVHFFYSYYTKMDELGRNIAGTGSWHPTILVMSVSHKNQEIRRKATEQDKIKYSLKWHQFVSNSGSELTAKTQYLDEQMASLRKLTGKPVAAPKRRGRPPNPPQIASVPP